jgi:hypothetical protein
MAYKPSEMTASQIQTELGIDGRKLGQYLARIKPVKERGKFQYYLLQDVIEQIYKKPGKVIPIDEIKKKKLQAEAELVELELEKEKGSVVPVKDIQRQWTNLVLSCKTKLLSIPTKLAPIMATETDINVCKNILDNSINEALTELSKGEDIEPVEDNKPTANAQPEGNEGVPTIRAIEYKPVRK